MAKAQAEASSSEEDQLAADSSGDGGAAAQAKAAQKRSNGTNQASIQKKAASAGERAASDLSKILVVDQALAENLARTILPVVQEVSGGLLHAVEPVLHEYRDDVAHAMEEQIRRAFPAIGPSLAATADGETQEANDGTESPSEPPSPGTDENAPTESADRVGRTDLPNMTTEARGHASSTEIAETKPDDTPGGTEMTSEAAQSEQTTNDESSEGAPEKAQASNEQSSNGKAQQRGRRQQGRGAEGRSQSRIYFYDPQGAARAGLLRLATDWKEAGSTYQAMHAYMEVLTRYPQSGAAAAATEGLVNLADSLQKQGRFYAALNIYDKLDAML
jgi:hypothetical protein